MINISNLKCFLYFVAILCPCCFVDFFVKKKDIMVNPYEVLDVQKDATLEEIKHKYHSLALQYHPDKAGAAGAEKFKAIQEAYEILSDPDRRGRYDRYGDLGENLAEASSIGGGVTLLVFIFFLLCSLLLIFTAFLVSFCDGKLTGSWNFVKVFSPLFAADGIIFLFCIILLLANASTFLFYLFAIFCGIALTILIPIGKDKNDSRVSDFIYWRVWLIPGYLLAVILFIHLLRDRLSSLVVLQRKCTILMFVLQTVGSLGIPLFVALVACRADEVITCSFFIAIFLPIAFCFGIDIICQFIYIWMVMTVLQSKTPYLGTIISMTSVQVFWKAMVIISAALVSKRLDDYYSRGTYNGTYSLANCLIPIFILISIVELISILALLCGRCYETTEKPSENMPEEENENVGQENFNTATEHENASVKNPEAPATTAAHISDLD